MYKLVSVLLLLVSTLWTFCLVHKCLAKEGKDRLRIYYMLYPRKTFADKARKMIIFLYFKYQGWSLNVFSDEGD